MHPLSTPRQFYDDLSEVYHLIFEDWDGSIARQGEALTRVLSRWPSSTGLILDAAAGIGTQALGLAMRGFSVVGSDLSHRALTRARGEFRARNVTLSLVCADFRSLPFRSSFADVAIACDNALPHLPSHGEVATALRELARCVRPGGGIVVSMRDYVRQPPGTHETRPYGERGWKGRRYVAQQEWDWHGDSYSLTLSFLPVDDATPPLHFRTTYFAIPIGDVLELMADAGLSHVQRIDDAFYQPLLIGTVGDAA